ncbi:unnamed protein product [Didymodactylos carnosus]|uniref:Uncharacterized protein n=1 Tax=Didymodactylos carnosus TaxID=1234261 RepID=A0A8S2DT96_9BILA|nr:unnamed protein product [Didymodactylos carnosus]CAF3812680.1 unnamed protein product [Didymodactylos carnosus]
MQINPSSNLPEKSPVLSSSQLANEMDELKSMIKSKEFVSTLVTSTLSQDTLISSNVNNIIDGDPFQKIINDIVEQKIASFEERIQQLENTISVLRESRDLLKCKFNDLEQCNRHCWFR